MTRLDNCIILDDVIIQLPSEFTESLRSVVLALLFAEDRRSGATRQKLIDDAVERVGRLIEHDLNSMKLLTPTGSRYAS